MNCTTFLILRLVEFQPQRRDHGTSDIPEGSKPSSRRLSESASDTTGKGKNGRTLEGCQMAEIPCRDRGVLIKVTGGVGLPASTTG